MLTPAEQIRLCRAILLHAQGAARGHDTPLRIDGFEQRDVNEAARVLVDEDLIVAQPPGTKVHDAYAGASITYSRVEFLEAYRLDQAADDAIRRSAARRSRSDTIAEIVSTLARAMYLTS